MDLTCFVYPGWEPRIRPAATKRSWMDAAPESFPYRCLPLGIANSYGWDILSQCSFEASWNGGMAAEDVTVNVLGKSGAVNPPVALFGQGTFTIHVQGLFRTPPGWNLYVTGPPNEFREGVVPLTGIIETDWAPYTFTMNWRLTRPDHPVRFAENEVIAHIFPIERGTIEQVLPQFVPIDVDPELKRQFEQWSHSREAFQEQVRQHPPPRPADKWQKLYHRGLTPDGRCPIADHQSKLKVRPFAAVELTGARAAEQRAVPHPGDQPPGDPRPAVGALEPSARINAEYEWLLSTLEQQRGLSAAASGIYRCEGLSTEEFLDEFYAPGRPVILAGEIGDWPALGRWSLDYLRSALAGRQIEYEGERASGLDPERDKERFKRCVTFEQFVGEMDGSNAFITTHDSAINQEALRPLSADMGTLDKFLFADGDAGVLRIDPAGMFTPLHHDLTNSLLIQVVGSKRVVLGAATELPNLYNGHDVFSEIEDVTGGQVDLSRFPRLENVALHEIILAPGEALFIPIGWWHQSTALDFSISVNHTNFLWRNDFHLNYPGTGLLCA